MIPGIYCLKIINDPTVESPSRRIIVTAKGAVLEAGNGDTIECNNISLAIDLDTVGPGGVDASPIATNETYHLFLIGDGQDIQGFASLAPTPELPDGFDYCIRIAAWPTGGAGNWFRMMTVGQKTSALLKMSGFEGRFSWLQPIGNPTTVDYETVVLTGIPVTALIAYGHALVTSDSSFLLVAANPLDSAERVGIIQYSGGPPGLSIRLYFEVPLPIPQTLTFYQTYGSGVVVSGWVDSVNAT